MHDAINNPFAATQLVSDYTTGKDDGGFPLHYGHAIASFRANEKLAVGNIVELVPPTTTVPLSVKKATTSSAGKIVGVVRDAAEAGESVTVVTYGHAFVLAGGSVSSGGAFTSNASGVATALTVDATAKVGDLVGNVLAAASNGNLAPAWINPR